MTDREKLVELLGGVQAGGVALDHEALKANAVQNEEVADYLIAHGVTVEQMQKPLTVEEVRKKDIVYLDERHGRTSCPCFIDPASTEHDMYFFTGLSCVFTHRVKAYNKFWRCWAEKPTEEERQAAEWEK